MIYDILSYILHIKNTHMQHTLKRCFLKGQGNILYYYILCIHEIHIFLYAQSPASPNALFLSKITLLLPILTYSEYRC